MQLLKEKASNGLLAKREWWSLGDMCEAMIVYEHGKCSINITGDSGDISLTIGEKINKERSRKYPTTVTIDSGFIEVPEDELNEVLSLIENLCCQ